MIKLSTLITFLFLSSSTLVHAHDTTHIHPLITSNIAKLIKKIDTATGGESAYKEIYELNTVAITGIADTDNLLYWGIDFDPLGYAGAPDKTDYLGADQTEQYLEFTVNDFYAPKKKNVITGAVYEDNPTIKVKDHFYHATSGAPLSDLDGASLGINSAYRAMLYFNNAINAMGQYTEEAKQDAFFIFGQSLHHVEDMSSPAHIHNDVHLSVLTNFHEEKDDYEGWWLPQQKHALLDVNLTTFFNDAANIRSVTNPWVDIWGTSDVSNSMVRYYYDSTTYNATLDFPYGDTYHTEGILLDTIVVDTRVPPPLLPQGELKEMFPCINTVTSSYDENEPNCLYWDDEDINQISHWKINSVGHFQHQYDNSYKNDWWPVEFEIDTSIVSDSNPRTFSGAYYIEQLSAENSTFNPLGTSVEPVNIRNNLIGGADATMVPNSKSLLEIYASNFLSPAVEYGAGFTKLWYDIANTPPYLKSLAVTQEQVGSTVTKSVYTGTWVPWVNSTATEENDRFLQLSNINHIHNQKKITLELTFNEPIKQITQLLLGSRNITVPTSGDLNTNDKVWTIQVAPAVLAGLNGKVQLTVKATDKNKHTEGTDIPGGGVASEAGGELDGTPDTPARRNIFISKLTFKDPTPQNYYPWYKTDGNADYNDKYSYDPENGDINHWLVFDSSAPSTTINVDVTLQ